MTRNDRITLIPKANGTVGAVVVRQNGIEMLLDKAYASAHIEGKGLVTRETYDPQKIAEEYGDALDAMPPRPVKFLVYFREGKDLLADESVQEIEKIIADLGSRPAPDIQVVGHTDSAGGREFNDKLSLQRAERVRAVLTQRGIKESSISVAGRGERELLIPTQDGVVEAGNRRVEINVR
ncbi:MAG: OmpA family protein [Burkholderiales bacterium]